MLIADDLNKLLEILPSFARIPLKQYANRKALIEVVMDLGRRPEARFPDGPIYLSNRTISWQDLEFSIRRIGSFGSDNRSGIERTLHRISSIRNRQGTVVGLTCRVGRAIFGTISVIRDLLHSQQSLLLLGKPGVGKTTAIREIARVLADEMEKRVVIIDTSNEIAGDGDIPHPAIGRARRMQVARPELQHQVMIEAVENHMPEVIIIDEIGTELEALAARTIAERGVQLVGTVHGNYLESLIKNPILSDLVGGIQYVTLGDDEARRRGTQKSILERKTASAFQVAIEIHNRSEWVVHPKVDEAVDQILQGYYALTQKRVANKSSEISISCKPVISNSNTMSKISMKKHDYSPLRTYLQNNLNPVGSRFLHSNGFSSQVKDLSYATQTKKGYFSVNLNAFNSPMLIYPYFINLKQIEAIANALSLPILITKDVSRADAVLALRSSIKKNNRLRQIAKTRNVMIYTIYSSTIPHITRALRKLLNIDVSSRTGSEQLYVAKNFNEMDALEEVREAIQKIVVTKQDIAELLPSVANLRKIQHHLVKLYNVKARSFGEEPNRRLRIYPR